MALIGSFLRVKDGYTGRLATLILDVELTLSPIANTETENAPSYRIHLGSDDTGPEIGAGWKRSGEKAGDYISLQIDDPTLAQPIRANLIHSGKGNVFHLQWTRPAKQNDRR
jgi:uncharacterized protein (DUF736 family)